MSRIKIQQQKENKLNFEKKNLKDYSFEDKFFKLTRYVKTIKISHSKKVGVTSTCSWGSEVETGR